jgi:hypothetical protein
MAYCGPRGIAHSLFLSWSRDDRDAALWWQRHQAQTCPSCGTRPADFAEDRNAFVAEPWHCRGCEIKQSEEARFERAASEYRRGTTIRLIPRPTET